MNSFNLQNIFIYVFITLLKYVPQAACNGESDSAPMEYETNSQNGSAADMPMIQASIYQMPAYAETDELSVPKMMIQKENSGVELTDTNTEPENKRVDRDYRNVELPVVHYRPTVEGETRLGKTPPSIDDDRKKATRSTKRHGESSAELEDDLIKILLYHQRERQLGAMNKTGKPVQKNGTKTSLDSPHKQPPPYYQHYAEQNVEKYTHSTPQETQLKSFKDNSPSTPPKSDYPDSTRFREYPASQPVPTYPSDSKYSNDYSYSSRPSQHSAQDYSDSNHKEYLPTQHKPSGYPEPRHLDDSSHDLLVTTDNSDTKMWKDSEYPRSQNVPQNNSDTNRLREYSHSQPQTSSNYSYSRSSKGYLPSQPVTLKKPDSKYLPRPTPTPSNYSNTNRYKETSRTNSYSTTRSEPTKFSKSYSPSYSQKNSGLKAPTNSSYSKPFTSSSRPINGGKDSFRSQRFSTTQASPNMSSPTKAPTCNYCGNERDCQIDEKVIKVTTCPKEYAYDFWNGRCVPKDTLGFCNGFCLKDGKAYEDLEDRYGYHRCEDGLVKKFKCPPDVKFDPLHRTCLPDYSNQHHHQ